MPHMMCVFVFTLGFKMRSPLYNSGGSSVAHSRFIDRQHLMRPLKVCRTWSAGSTVVKGQRRSYRSSIDAEQNREAVLCRQLRL